MFRKRKKNEIERKKRKAREHTHMTTHVYIKCFGYHMAKENKRELCEEKML